jgi:hypothetical protein
LNGFSQSAPRPPHRRRQRRLRLRRKASLRPKPAAPQPTPGPGPAPAGASVLARLKEARETLELKDLAGAMAIYEEVLATAGDRPDVLVTISGDLGVTGHTREIIELIAPRYDAARHGPATGFNLLQAYLAVRDPQAAQHVLDLLFALNRPELQERLFGFSNVVADMMLLEAEGTIVPAPAAAADEGVARVDLVTISKPIWSYGLENMPALLPPKEGKLRRVAFGQLSVLRLKDLDAAMQQPEDELGRLSRGIPLWLSEMLFFSANYDSVTAAATIQRDHYALFNALWAPDHIRQLVDTVQGGLDYVFVGTLEQKHADYELVLRVWEVKKFRERKTFTVRWTPATADQALAQFGAQLRAFVEFTPYPAGQGLVWAPPARLRDYAEALGAGLTFFLTEKQVLPATRLVLPASVLQGADQAAAQAETAALLALGLRARARRLGLTVPPVPDGWADTPVVAQARQELGL